MRGISATERFIAWARNQDEKKMAWLAGSVVVAAVCFLYPGPPWWLRAGLASTAIAAGYYKAGRSPSLKKFGKTWAYILGSLTAWHYARVWFGTGWWALLAIFLLFTLWKIYKLRPFVKAWWTWYKQYLGAAWKGELRKKTFSERVNDAMRRRRK